MKKQAPKSSGKKLVNTDAKFGKKGQPAETGRDTRMATEESRHGGDRKTGDFHLQRAGHHIVKALEKRLSERDKK